MEENAGPLSPEEENATAAAAGDLYPMYFGASCSFLALQLLSRASGPDLDSARRLRLAEVLLRGSARLLGLLVWRLQRGKETLQESLGAAESEVAELKRLRAEDAKANDKVAGIFASREQSWIAEKKRLKTEIRAAKTQLCLLESQKEEAVEEKDRVIRSKDDALAEEIGKRTELEEKLWAAGEAREEARERAKKSARDHESELWKHRTAFAELVSNHRQLEAEMGRALRQVEVAKRELDEAFEQKEEAVAVAEKVAEELVRAQRDAEQKGKILSAMLRKAKLDAAEKQALLKEVRVSMAREKQVELEMQRLRNRRRFRALHSMEADRLHHQRTLLLDYLQTESTMNSECASPERGDIVAVGGLLRQSSVKENEEELDIRQLQKWVRSEIENCTSIFQQRHYTEIDAFTEQIRLKDEKLEVYRWRLLSMELESKRLQSRVQGLDGDLCMSREESSRLQALLLDRERELKSLKGQLDIHTLQRGDGDRNWSAPSPPFDPRALWSEVRITRRQELGTIQDEESPPVGGSLVQDGGGDWKSIDGAKQIQVQSQEDGEENPTQMAEPRLLRISLAASALFTDQLEVHEASVEEVERRETPSGHQEQGMTNQTHSEEAEEEKEAAMGPGYAQLQAKRPGVQEVIDKQGVSDNSSTGRDSSRRVDLHVLGISYKIKRLRQQLLVIEKLAGAQLVKQPAEEEEVGRTPRGCGRGMSDENGQQQPEGFLLLISLLNRQVKRYQSLEEKADDLSNRMQDSDRAGRTQGPPSFGRTKEQTGALRGFLEEAFQLQRHVVATGQKLTEIQARLAGSVASGEGGHLPELNAEQFADVVRKLFREIQRGFEVRVARVIGGLEGTLARDGILHRRS